VERGRSRPFHRQCRFSKVSKVFAAVTEFAAEFVGDQAGYPGHVDRRKRVPAFSKVPLDTVPGTCDLIAADL
jgi:hypothetical protein